MLAVAAAPWTRPSLPASGSYCAGVLGLLAVHERLRREFTAVAAACATLLLFAGTSLFWVMTRTGAATEAAAFAAVAACLLVPHLTPRARPAWAWVAAALVPLGIVLASNPNEAAVAGPAAGWSARLFSSSHRLLSLTPLAYVAVVGTLAYARRNPVWVGSAAGVAAVWLVALSAVPALAPGEAPFDHGLNALLAVVATGLCHVVDSACRRPWLATAPLAGAAVVWNYWLMVQYTAGLLPKDAPVSFAALVRRQADVHTTTPYLYPFALPANAWFAWREGLAVDRYDLLAHQPRRSSLDLVMDGAATPLLLEGWEARNPADQTAHRWIRDRRAALVLPLERPAGDVDVFVTARARLDDPPVAATLGLEINGREIGRFTAPPTAPVEFSLPARANVIGGVWRAGYNRVTFVSYGIARTDQADQRRATSAGQSGDRAWPVAVYRIRIVPR